MTKWDLSPEGEQRLRQMSNEQKETATRNLNPPHFFYCMVMIEEMLQAIRRLSSQELRKGQRRPGGSEQELHSFLMHINDRAREAEEAFYAVLPVLRESHSKPL